LSGRAAWLLGLVLASATLGGHAAAQAVNPPASSQTPQPSEPTGRRERIYLAELAMSLESARRFVLWVEAYGADGELARFAYPLAERLVESASHLTPPARWVPAHPHVLLITENVERALDAAAAADLASFRHHARIVREELSILDGLFKQLKLKLPELGR
jgi:hypothetical protein